ncbi:TPA: hypothetical protein NGU01_002479 [Vibrio parahaemolyticus]|nr:hypothetical protein [Vibrio parahaemolyticus]
MEEYEENDSSQIFNLRVRMLKDSDDQESTLSMIKDILEERGLLLESVQSSSEYFINQESEFIYYLAVLDGDAQAKALGIAPSFYKDKKKAKSWRDQIVRKIHPDRSQHPDAGKATEVLNNLYKRMLKNAK